jgi:hypothetical protein
MHRPRVIDEAGVGGYVAEKVGTGRWSAATGEQRASILGRFVRDMAGEELTAESVSRWVTGVDYSAYYRRTRWMAVTGFLRWVVV